MPTPASGKYIINKVAASGVPNFFAPQNDTELIQFARNEGATGADTGSVAAVLDWELCTLGDPLADLGYVGIYWTDPGRPITRTNDPSGLPGFCTFDHLVERYATRTGRDVSNIGYYKAFASFRLAVISEGVYARYLHGAMGEHNVDLEPLKLGTENLAEAALAALKGR
jgi:hypothetical protein